jgi:branched-chain amino acid transport system permease protein
VVFAFFLLMTWYLLYRTSFGLCVQAGVNRALADDGHPLAARDPLRLHVQRDGERPVGLLIGPCSAAKSHGREPDREGIHGGHPRRARQSVRVGGRRRAHRLVEALVAGYGSSQHAEPIIFALILVILFFRPYGLLGDIEAVRR